MTFPPTKADDRPHTPHTETWNYAIRYKYGPVVMKAGKACYRLNQSTYLQQPALKLSLDFQTNSFFDKIFFIRDTLTSYAAFPDGIPLYHTRSINEGNTRFVEEMWMQKFGDEYTEWQVKRKQDDEIQLDTILVASNLGFDSLSILLYIQQLDYPSLNPGESRQITTFLGNRKTNLIIHYAGPKSIERKNSQPENTFLLSVDIADEVFSEAKNAMEIWISDDEHRIPLKMKAKLKIGAAEAELL